MDDMNYAVPDYAPEVVQEEAPVVAEKEAYTYYEFKEKVMTKEQYEIYRMLQEQTQEIITHSTEKDVEKAIDEYTLELVEEGLI